MKVKMPDPKVEAEHFNGFEEPASVGELESIELYIRSLMARTLRAAAAASYSVSRGCQLDIDAFASPQIIRQRMGKYITDELERMASEIENAD